MSLQSNAEDVPKISWSDYFKRKKENSIEHIYPQAATKRCWTKDYSQYSKKNKRRLLHGLGNLVLISQTKNSEFQNRCFNEKRKHIDNNGNEVGFYNGSYSEIEVSEMGREDEWTAKDIYNRGLKMLEFLEERWEVILEDENGVDNKKQILGIDFEF